MERTINANQTSFNVSLAKSNKNCRKRTEERIYCSCNAMAMVVECNRLMFSYLLSIRALEVAISIVS